MIFTDGACSRNGKKEAKTGCGIYFQNSECEYSLSLEAAKIRTSYESDLKSTNNTGELMAILCALCISLTKEMNDKRIVIYSDSSYAINCSTIWYKKWESNNWIASNKHPVKNKELIQRIIIEKDKFSDIVFKYTKAHSTAPEDKSSKEYLIWYGNNKADELARNAK